MRTETDSRVTEKAKQLVERLFPVRQVLIRSNGRVRCVTFSPRFQIFAVVAAFLMAGWSGFSSGIYFQHDQTLRAKNLEIVRIEEGYRGLLNELVESQEKILANALALEQEQGNLLKMMEAGGQFETVLSNLRGLRRPSKKDKTQIARARAIVAGHRETLEREVRRLVGNKQGLDLTLRATKKRLRQVENERRRVSEAHAALRNRLNGVEGDLQAVTGQNANLKENLATTKAALETILSERTQVAGDRDRLQNQLTVLETRLSAVKETQQDLVARLVERTGNGIATIERVITLAGLNPDKMLSRAGRGKRRQGGPFIPASLVKGKAANLGLAAKVAVLERQFSRWAGLQNIVRRLPLSAPLDQYRVTSRFGKRRDPVNNKWAMHRGIDLAAPLRTPILSTAPGRVVFAGRDGQYGRTIEIDHGGGIRSRYAHLRRILVKRGQKIGFRHKIGLLGNSGRSTGAHVHYEIRINGVARNPLKFLKAGKYVFKG